MINKGRSVAFHTFGCKLNFSETSYISKLFLERGYRIVDFGHEADFYVLQTCTVTQMAEKKCRTLIRNIKKRFPNSKTAVIGCYSELRRSEIEAMPEVDFVLGNFDKYALIDLIENTPEDPSKWTPSLFIPTFSSGDRTRSFLKVQDGCDYFCSYCAIPYARGRSRSNTIAETLMTAQQAIDSGAMEMVLTGVNVGDFGKQHGETFLELIQALDTIAWNGRIRLSSIEPELLSDEIIRFVALSQHFMPHFHIPLQSGSDKILQLMRRRYLRGLFAQRVEAIRKVLPFACIAVDVIVGFPNETQEDFLDTVNFLDSLEISALHVFPYSERQGTPAAEMTGKVPLEQRHERSRILQQLSDDKKKAFIKNNIGRSEKVLFESERSKGKMYGFTRNYIRVATTFDEELINKEVAIDLQQLNDDNDFIYHK